jgi:hypothetical protein
VPFSSFTASAAFGDRRKLDHRVTATGTGDTAIADLGSGGPPVEPKGELVEVVGLGSLFGAERRRALVDLGSVLPGRRVLDRGAGFQPMSPGGVPIPNSGVEGSSPSEMPDATTSSQLAGPTLTAIGRSSCSMSRPIHHGYPGPADSG